MAGDWIKMRTNLLTHPKVIGIADHLAADRNFIAWLSGGNITILSGGRLDVTDSATDVVTFSALRLVTLGALLQVWGAANEHTHDGFFPGLALAALDDIAGVPGFGGAMAHVGWATHDTDCEGVSLPNFTEYNTPGRARPLTNAQRQALYRARRRTPEEVPDAVTKRNETVTKRNENSNAREEKIREEYKTPPTPPGGECETNVYNDSPSSGKSDGDGVNAPADASGPGAGKPVRARRSKSPEPPGFEEFWMDYPRKTAKVSARKAWANLAPDDALRRAIGDALRRQKGWDQWLRGVIPHASTWLNQRRWEDEGQRAVEESDPETPLERAARQAAEREEQQRRVAEAVAFVFRRPDNHSVPAGEGGADCTTETEMDF